MEPSITPSRVGKMPGEIRKREGLGKMEGWGQQEIGYDTRTSHLVTQGSTILAHGRLAAEF